MMLQKDISRQTIPCSQKIFDTNSFSININEIFGDPLQFASKLLELYSTLLHYAYAKDKRFKSHLSMFVSEIRLYTEPFFFSLIAGLHLQAYNIPYPALKSLHQAILCEEIGRIYGLDSELRKSLIAASLTANLSIHSLQKTLSSQTEPLNNIQKSIIKQHPIQTCTHLEALGVNDPIMLDVIKQYCESLNGAGYPNGLEDGDICIAAQLLSVTNRYTSMILPRCYRQAVHPSEIRSLFYHSKNTKHNAFIIDILLMHINLFPVGMHVRLINGEEGIVIKHGEPDPKEPIVLAYCNKFGEIYNEPVHRYCNHSDYNIDAFIEPIHFEKVDETILWTYV